MKSPMEQMVEWLSKQDYRGNNPLDGAIREARRLLKEEQAQKPEAPAGMIEEIERFSFPLLDGTPYGIELRTILSRYRPATAKSADRCDMCGGIKVIVRGKYPKDPDREICPTCAIEKLEDLQQDTMARKSEFSKDADGKEVK